MPTAGPGFAPGNPEIQKDVDRRERWRRTNRGTLSAVEVAQLWVDAGGPADAAAMASVVSKHESRRRVTARGPLTRGHRAIGLMQIYPDGPVNAWENMKAAVAKYEASGWQPWSVCNGGSAVGDHDAYAAGTKGCENLAKEAARLDRKLRRGGGILEGISGDFGSSQSGFGDVDLNPIDDVAGAIAAVFEPLGDFFKIITSADTWIRVGKVLLGALILLIVAVELMGGANRLARKVRGA